MKYPQFEITSDDVMRAALDLNFEFFADLIRCGTIEMEPATRDMAANFLTYFLDGQWSTKGERRKLRTLGEYDKIATRVAELQASNGLESAVNQVAREICVPGKKSPERTVWKAWQVRCAKEKSLEAMHRALAELRAHGGSAQEEVKMLKARADAMRRERDRLLKRKG